MDADEVLTPSARIRAQAVLRSIEFEDDEEEAERLTAVAIMEAYTDGLAAGRAEVQIAEYERGKRVGREERKDELVGVRGVLAEALNTITALQKRIDEAPRASVTKNVDGIITDIRQNMPLHLISQAYAGGQTVEQVALVPLEDPRNAHEEDTPV